MPSIKTRIAMIAITKENEDQFVTEKDCKDCPHDSACSGVKDSRGENVCICYHFGKEPLRKGTVCRRNIVKGLQKPDFQNNEAHWPSMGHNQSLIQVQILGHSGSNVISSAAEQGFYVSSSSITVSVALLSIFGLTTFILAMGFHLKKKSRKSILQALQAKKEDLSGNENVSLSTNRFVNNSYEKTCLDLSIEALAKEEIHLLSQIGEGCFGKVFKGSLHGKVVAVKVFKKYSEEAIKEVETMAAFSHPNILPLIGFCQNAELEAPWIVFEFMELGDLNTLLRNSFNNNNTASATLLSGLVRFSGSWGHPQGEHAFNITNDYLMNFALQIADGMNYLSSHHFVHRDLAARNCLVSANGVLKISDFGLSRDVYTCDYYRIGSDSKLLPLRWMSPESIMYAKFTTESDIYSYGVLLWELFTMAKQPYYGFDNDQAMKMIITGSLLIPPSNCPNIICEIMATCWKTEAKDRPKFDHVVHRLMTTNSGKDMESADGLKPESCYETPITIVLKSEYMEVI